MYLRDCHSVWRTFVHFAAQEAGNGLLSEHLVTQFLESRGISAKLTSSELSSHQRLIRAAMRMLTRFHLHGCYQRPRRIQQHVTLPLCLVHRFEGLCKNHQAQT